MTLIVDLIRHAESRMNVDMADARIPFIGGRQNEIDLSELGETQALKLGRYAMSHDLRPMDVYSSPAVRTRRTHELSAFAMGLVIEPKVDDRLQELDQGEWTNQPRALYDDPDIRREMVSLGSDFAPPGGESMNVVYERAAAFMESLVTPELIEGPRYIWVHSHGVVIKTFVGKLLGKTHEETYKTPIDNASRTRIVYDNGQWRVEFVNRPTSE
ncbi:MAG TPA: histidine phosphatase family protein [Candidatus Chromulinivoraceae bacterium]|nr:histidine phosphatase family protein [Candidatus Chromulinivoraceae bacterium]